MMVKRITKQRVAVALVSTVWLTSIVGASVPPVPLRETTGFPNLRSSGPSSDQYTPLLRNPPNNQRQDHHGRGWMNDPHPRRINVRNSQEEKFLISEFESPPNYELMNDRKEYDRRINDLENDGDDTKLDNAEVQRLSSMKLAFDDPIDFSDQIEEENEKRYEVNEGEDWRTEDGIKEDGVMQRDEFLGDDTFEDEGPGSVEVYKLDLFRDTPILNQRSGRRIISNERKTKSKIPKKVNIKSTRTMTTKEFDDLKSREGEGGEGEEKRGENIRENNTTTRSLKERIFGTGGVPELQVGCEGVEGSQQRDKRSENNLGNDKKKIHISNPPTIDTEIDYDLEDYYDLLEGPEDPRYSMIKSSRGDMDPKIKTPADIEARKILLKGQLPKRGDLGVAWEESLSKTERVRGEEIGREKRNIKLMNIKNDDFRENKLKRRHRRGQRKYGNKKLRINNKIRNVNELKSRRENRRYNRDLKKSKRYSDENERKLADYVRRNTPINPIKNYAKKYRYDNRVPADLIRQSGGRGPDIYAIERHNLLEQRRPETEGINRATYEEQRKREATNVIRPDNQVIYKGRTRQEIERLKSLPVQSLIVIDVRNSSNVPDIVESRFGNEVSNKPSVTGPSPCVWAIINCCPNKIRLTTCFEAKGCPGGHWDNPCTAERISSALGVVAHYYAR